MLKRFSIELTKWTSKGGMCAKRLAHDAGISLSSVYAARNGVVSAVNMIRLFVRMPADMQARIGAEEGLLIQPLVDNGATLPEAAARVADFNAEFVHSMTDGRADRTKRQRLREKAAGLVAKLSGWLRREQVSV